MAMPAIETEKDLHHMGDTYIKVNDALPEHRKIVAVGGDAAWLHICAIAYCSRNLTDGRIPMGVVPRLSDRKRPEKLAARLAEVRLWHTAGHDCDRCPQPGPDEYLIHDYLNHQRSAAHIESIKEKRAIAGRAGGTKKAANGGGGKPKAEAKQPSSKLLDGCNDSAVANATPVSEEVLRTSQPEEPLRGSQTDAEPPPPNPPPPSEPSPMAGEKAGEGDQDHPETIELALVAEVRAIRPEWTSGSIGRALTHPDVLERPAGMRRPALLAVARDPESRSPGRLAADGPWWQAARRATMPRVDVWTAPPVEPASDEARRVALDELHSNGWYRKARSS
jgi:hypothetical protein